MRCIGSSTISIHCAIQPTVRAMANNTVNIEVGKQHGARLIDVNAVTTAENGQARRGHYIDTNHIRPTALIEAFSPDA